MSFNDLPEATRAEYARIRREQGGMKRYILIS